MKARCASLALAFLVALGVFAAIAARGATTATATAMRYDRLDATGAVTAAGSYAFLTAGSASGSPEVIATWEGLRSAAATLRLHQSDASGASRAAAYGAVGEGDIVEWRKADDCWVRYRVTAAPTRPASGSLAPSRWEFPVAWMTYAATGAGCTGAVGASTAVSVKVGDLPNIQSPSITSPVRHGPWLLIPPGWTGARPAIVRFPSPCDPQPTVAKNLAAARRLPLWRDPVMPIGWTFLEAASGDGHYYPPCGFTAYYLNAQGGAGAEITVYPQAGENLPVVALRGDAAWIRETRIIDGRPALVTYAPPGGRQYLPTTVSIADETTRVTYSVEGEDRTLSGSNIGATIEIARSLYPSPAPTPDHTRHIDRSLGDFFR